MSSGVVEASDGLDRYELVRFNEARLVGLTMVEAWRFATGDQPLHLLWRLKAEGCCPRVLAEIVT